MFYSTNKNNHGANYDLEMGRPLKRSETSHSDSNTTNVTNKLPNKTFCTSPESNLKMKNFWTNRNQIRNEKGLKSLPVLTLTAHYYDSSSDENNENIYGQKNTSEDESLDEFHKSLEQSNKKRKRTDVDQENNIISCSILGDCFEK